MIYSIIVVPAQIMANKVVANKIPIDPVILTDRCYWRRLGQNSATSTEFVMHVRGGLLQWHLVTQYSPIKWRGDPRWGVLFYAMLHYSNLSLPYMLIQSTPLFTAPAAVAHFSCSLTWALEGPPLKTLVQGLFLQVFVREPPGAALSFAQEGPELPQLPPESNGRWFDGNNY